MKKVLLILMLGVFTFGSSSFTTHKKISYQEDCDESFNTLYEFAINNGASEDIAQQQAGNYWANCVNNGGSSRILEVISIMF